MLQEEILADDMFLNYGIEVDDYNAAFEHYNLLKDPEINNKLFETF